MRLIDADELIEHAWKDKLDSRELIAEMIETAPTIKEIPTSIPIDVFEQLVLEKPKTESVTEFADRCRECGKMRKGHWIWNFDKGYCKCSECGIGMGHKEFDYCPNCGCRMESEETDE